MSFEGQWGVVDMLDRSQFDSCCSGELRVQSQYVDCELHLVDDTLAGSMTARKEFKILELVMLAISVAMVNCFLRVKFTAEVLRHYIAMFHHAPWTTISRQHRYGYPNVAVSFDVLFVAARFEFFLCSFLEKFDATFWRAVFLLFVQSSARFTAFIEHTAASLARKCVFCFCGFLSTARRAFSGAVHGIVSVFLLVLFEIRPLHRKGSSTLFAGKTDFFFAGRGVWQGEPEGGSAAKAAKTLFGTWVAEKRLLALFTKLFETHGDDLLFGRGSIVSMRFGVVK
jgi:hypothetical protein